MYHMTFEVELPEKYAERLEEVEAVAPTVRDQIEVEVLPVILRLVNDAHQQIQDTDDHAVQISDDDS